MIKSTHMRVAHSFICNCYAFRIRTPEIVVPLHVCSTCAATPIIGFPNDVAVTCVTQSPLRRVRSLFGCIRASAARASSTLNRGRECARVLFARLVTPPQNAKRRNNFSKIGVRASRLRHVVRSGRCSPRTADERCMCHR